MQVLNPKQSSEKGHVVPEADPFSEGAGDGGGTFMTRTSPSTGVADGIESHRDPSTNQASSGPDKGFNALGENMPAPRAFRRVTACNVKGAAATAPGRGILPGKPDRLLAHFAITDNLRQCTTSDILSWTGFWGQLPEIDLAQSFLPSRSK